MRKIFAIILAITLTLTLFASCGKPETALTSTELLDLGEKYLLDLDYEQAIVYFNQVIEVEPRNSRAYMGEAEAYIGLGDTESAIDILKTALEVFSDDEDVTIELLKMLIEFDPTTAEWYLDLAQIYIDRGDTDKAIEVLEQGLNNASDTTDIKELLYAVEESIHPIREYVVGGYWKEYEYDSNWNLVGSVMYNMDGSVYTEYKYDLDGNVLMYKYHDPDSGKITYWYEVEYDSYGREVKYAEYNYEGNIKWWCEREYDENGTEIRYIKYYNNGDMSDLYEYDENGNRTKTIYYNYGGSINSWYEHEYDENNNEIKEISYYSDGRYKYIYEYNSYGDKISDIRYKSSGTVSSYTTYEYEYYDNGNIKTRVERDGSGYSHVYEYDENENIQKVTEYDRLGNLSQYTLYEYDDDGKKIRAVMYHSSGAILGWTDYEYDENGKEMGSTLHAAD